MEIFIYAIIFIIGTFFGSFFTLAVYRIPRKEDILIKHSYCPNCNHKLGFFDLFPVLSYLFLGGKCRYCENKIRPRYLILEVLSGVVFLSLAISTRININNIYSIINTAFILIYVSVLFIISGIDKENVKIEKPVLIFGFIIELLYIIYQYALKTINVYQYVMYLSIFAIILFVFNIGITNSIKKQYYIEILVLSLFILFFTSIKIFISTILLSLIIIFIYKILKKEQQLPIGFYLSISNIIIIVISNLITNYI